MSSFTFTCPLTMTNLSIIKDDPSKIKIWRNSILFGYPSMKFITFFEVDSKEEYVKLIEKNLNNNKNLEKLFNLYKKNKAIESINGSKTNISTTYRLCSIKSE